MYRKSERRAHNRSKAPIFAALEQRFGGIAFDQTFSVVVDVSEGGMCVKAVERPQLNTALIVRAGVGENIYELKARIVRSRPCADGTVELGLKFCWTEQNQIHEFVEALFDQSRRSAVWLT